MERRDKMKKSYVNIFLFITSIGILIFNVGCQKNESQKVAEKFIKTQVNCGTYITSAGDEEVLKKVFLDFFTEETYEQYLDDAVGYFYPELFRVLHVDESNIHKIKCKEKTKNTDGSITYEFEVSYTLVDLDESKKKTVDKYKLKDYLQITMNEQDKITKVVVLNTSDIIKKLFLDIKVQ